MTGRTDGSEQEDGITLGTPLIDRIKEREAPAPIPVIRCKPAWVRRLEAKQLPAKDFSNGAYVPSGSDGAA